MPKAFERRLVLEGAHNVRDLGGYPTRAGGTTRWRSLLRSDGLHLLSRADIDSLLEEGLSAVIDLRSPQETALEFNPFDTGSRARYSNVSLFDALAPLAQLGEAAAASFDMADRYRDAIENCQPAIAEVLRIIACIPDGIVLFHCSAGKDRTGIIAAILLALADVDDETIVEDYAMTGHVAGPLIERLREKALQRGTEPALVERFLASEPQSMRAMLQHMALKYGSAEAYAARIGLSDTEIGRLRRRILERDAETCARFSGGIPR
jgi:protein-tyrosine phosphatase